MPIDDPNYTRHSFDLENDVYGWLRSVASPEGGIPRVSVFRLVNALLKLAINQTKENEIPGLEPWEVGAIINFFQHARFRNLEPDVFWVRLQEINEELALKVGTLPQEVRLQLLLKVLYERKNTLAK